MHLLCLGVMKSLIEKWIGSRKSMGRIKVQKKIIWKEFMLTLQSAVPKEFQRKDFDLDN